MINTQLLITKRTEAGLSQRQLAKHAGVNRETIRRVENGSDASQLPLVVVFRIAGALQMPAGELVEDCQSPTDATPSTPADLDPKPLDYNAARLLRRIHRGEDVRRTMSKTEREIILPQLSRKQILTCHTDGYAMSEAFRTAVSRAMPQSPTPPHNGGDRQ